MANLPVMTMAEIGMIYTRKDIHQLHCTGSQ